MEENPTEELYDDIDEKYDFEEEFEDMSVEEIAESLIEDYGTLEDGDGEYRRSDFYIVADWIYDDINEAA